MQYISTRGSAPALTFPDAVLAGLASDGGLYLPESYPQFSAAEWQKLATLPYPELAARIMEPYVGSSIPYSTLLALAQQTYSKFHHPAIAPLKQLSHDHWLLELFHGPTIAFKDYALQFLGRLFDYLLEKRSKKLTIIGATSGDTGSAAIEACRDKSTMDIIILYPHGRVSDVQRRQMTTVASSNVHTIALEGTFDDCQNMLKALFSDMSLRQERHLSAVNSINWARILAQVVYYAYAALALGAPHRAVSFAVPTGNFGNVFAAYVAPQMGLPVKHLAIGTNKNDILTRFFETGSMSITGVEPSISPSMDIQVSSNFERLLFDHYKRDGAQVALAMNGFRQSGKFQISAEGLLQLQRTFKAYRLDDDQTLAVIRKVYQETGELIDPHTAIGVAAAGRAIEPGIPVVSLACAHPAKFPKAVKQATGVHPPLPDWLADLHQRQERTTVLPNSYSQVKEFVLGCTSSSLAS
ncbi:threonine synthase [Leptolyngbya sp. FACHB-261]|uniref:threonine synthase n=1 Tax=Leptolyngbya sp. FACHB-261 TaxID=2692806 RepID=UPI0016894AF5|nr:threonine synthase [Leptolyngbya sp. FACHB-261]MBD2103998.1 threonine synthase [Leptolyngbya sp. FACHB-261]